MSTVSKIININSADRISGTNDNFIVKLGSNNDLDNVKRITLKSFYYTNTAYNVNDSNNNLLIHFLPGPVEVKTTFAKGFYNLNDIMTTALAAINAQMTAQGITQVMTITYDSLTKKITFHLTAGIYTFSVESFEPKKSLAGMLGYYENLVPSLNETAQSIIDLTGLEIIHIMSKRLASNNGITSNQDMKDLFVDIPVDVAFGFNGQYQGTYDELNSLNYNSKIALNIVDIQLLDQNFNSIDFQEFPISLIFKVYY